jgi:hypothetical protein
MPFARIRFGGLLVAAALTIVLAAEAPADAARRRVAKFSNPGAAAIGAPDGIAPGGDRENSYAWSMESFRQSDAEYLWVGSNRDLLYLVLRAAKLTDGQIDESFAGTVPIPAGGAVAEQDYGARLFRRRLDGSRAWELAYRSPLFPPTLPPGATQPRVPLDAGYRGMQRFADADGRDPSLYVVTFGSALGYTRVLQFPRAFEPGDEPVEVLRAGGSQSLRAIAVHDRRLCVGTFTGEILCSANPPAQAPVSAVPAPPAERTATAGWERVASAAAYPGGGLAPGQGVWQLISYNGWLYAFIGNPLVVGDERSGGFLVFKGRPAAAGGWEWRAIVGNGGPYPKGAGNRLNAAAGPYLFKGRVYVGTFFDVPGLAVQRGGAAELVANWTPAQVYRFDADDRWELVVGDPNPAFPRRIGNFGAGFYNPSPLQRLFLPAPYADANLSLTPYVWWMAAYGGRLYATTFDMRVFLEGLDAASLATLGITDPAVAAQLDALKSAIATFNTNRAGFDLWSTADGVNWAPVTTDGFGDPFNYGGRTLKATSRGLFIGTANPFFGAEVWRLWLVP